MSEHAETRFACIGCGALNPVGAPSCSGCGHAFGGPLAPTPGTWAGQPDPPTPATPLHEIRTSRDPGRPTFRIGTAMLFVAVIGACLGAFAANEALGALLSIGLIPASIRMAMVSGRRRAEGRPMSAEEWVGSFVLIFVTVYLIGLASLIAFGVTCFPIGLASQNFVIACGAGGLVAIFVAVKITRFAVRADRGIPKPERPDSEIS